MKNGELFDYVYASDKKFPRKLARYYFKQILEGVNFMH